MKENILLQKTYDFALNIVKTYQYLVREKKEFVIAKQLLRSGTSVGANAEEAIGGQSEKDFVSKLSIVYKEARETKFWLRLLRDSEILEQDLAEKRLEECEEILRITGKIISTCKKKIDNS